MLSWFIGDDQDQDFPSSLLLLLLLRFSCEIWVLLVEYVPIVMSSLSDVETDFCSEGSDVDGADETLLAATGCVHLHHPAHAHHRVDVVQAHLSLIKFPATLRVCALRPTRAGEAFALHLTLDTSKSTLTG